jgi:hypothetical protein
MYAVYLEYTLQFKRRGVCVMRLVCGERKELLQSCTMRWNCRGGLMMNIGLRHGGMNRTYEVGICIWSKETKVA